MDAGCAALTEGWSEEEAIAAGQRGTSDCGRQASGMQYTDPEGLQRVNKTRTARNQGVQRCACERVRVEVEASRQAQ